MSNWNKCNVKKNNYLKKTKKLRQSKEECVNRILWVKVLFLQDNLCFKLKIIEVLLKIKKKKKSKILIK